MTTINPLTQRSIKIGSAVYNKLVRDGIIKAQPTIDIFATLGDAEIYALCRQMDPETLARFRLTSKRVADICGKELLEELIPRVRYLTESWKDNYLTGKVYNPKVVGDKTRIVGVGPIKLYLPVAPYVYLLLQLRGDITPEKLARLIKEAYNQPITDRWITAYTKYFAPEELETLQSMKERGKRYKDVLFTFSSYHYIDSIELRPPNQYIIQTKIEK